MDSRELPETFRWNPAGIQSCPLEPGQQAEASLAWASVTASAKRRQRRCRTMLLCPEISFVVVLAVSCTGDRAVASQWLDVNGTAGVAGTWWASTGVPQEQERPVTLREKKRLMGRAAHKQPGPRFRPVDRRESGPGPAGKSRTHAGHLAVPAGETNEFAGMEGQESECLHSTETRRTCVRALNAGDRRRANCSTGASFRVRRREV